MAKVKTFGTSYGLTLEHKGIYHKFNSMIEVELEEADDTEKVKEVAWNTVKEEVAKQVKELFEE